MLLVRLRWQLLLNSLRRPTRRAELGLQAIWVLMGAGFVLLGSVGFFFGGFGLLKIDRADLLDLPLWAIFLVWQLAPVLFEGYSPGLNFREVSRYPIPFRVLFILSAAYGLSDPAAIACVCWLFSFWLGIIIARPEFAFAATPALLLFTVFNLFLNRLVIGLFDRFQSTRKGRERMVLLAFVAIILLNLLNIVQLNISHQARTHGFKFPEWVGQAVTTIREFSPPGMAAHTFLQNGLSALWAFSGLLLYGFLAYMLLQRQLKVLYLGEIYAETHTVHRELKVRQGWRFPFLDEVTAAIVEKELRYIRQSFRIVLQLIYPPVIFLLLAFNGTGWKSFFAGRSQVMLAGLAGFMLMSVPNLSYNVFGMDKEGFGRWLLSPPPLRKVLMGKNLTHASLLVVLYLVVAAVLLAITPVGVLPTLTVTVAFFAVLIIQLSAGNVVSVHWPKRIELTRMNSRMASNAAGLASLVVMLPLTALIGTVILVSWHWQLRWLPLVCGVIAFAASLKLYSYVLDWAARYTWEHIEEITGNLGA
ncbi:MAG TPA: hypothetical protein VFB76_14320 [Candidatus Angelobacter sp.]|nr:hypothetical protein [Candidatus Angelobacter sp.]